jgi:uncharacterized damage-inducible protein DinB
MEHSVKTEQSEFITLEELRDHWQGHRRLTRHVIEAFPEEKLFGYSIGGMRPFSELARELMGIAAGGIRGIATREWSIPEEMAYHESSSPPKTKAELLARWDTTTADIDDLWPKIPAGRFRETDTAFGLYEGTVWSHILYFIENENHHRGQGYVYLRSLGIEPPYFWERE